MRSIIPFSTSFPQRLAFPALRGDMGRLLGTFFDGDWDAGAEQAGFRPGIDVSEDADALIVKADLPGVDPNDLDVSVSDGVLSIQGERKSEERSEHGQNHVVERRFGSFRRSFTLPNNLNVDAIEATHDRGVLTIKLPKVAEAKTRKIAVQAVK